MGISKIDILGKKFNRCMRGYCTEEVDLFLHDAAEALGEAADENRRLAERLVELEHQSQLERHQPSRHAETILAQPPDDLRGALAAGRKIVEDIQDSARREAQRIVEDARQEGVRLREEANLVKAKIFEEIADLKAQKEAFWQELRKLLEDHFRLLEDQQKAAAGGVEGEFTFAESREEP